jgi:hypothetical protein
MPDLILYPYEKPRQDQQTHDKQGNAYQTIPPRPNQHPNGGSKKAEEG